jgi:iron-only hydrogenase group A
MKKIIITIDGQKCEAFPGESVLQATIRNKIDIPHFCYHEDLDVEANCRTCLVETPDGKTHTSCSLPCVDGLNLLLHKSEKVDRLRRENMELLFAEHHKTCPRCIHGDHCETAEILKKYKVTGTKYTRDHPLRKVHKMATSAEFDPEVCVACNKCVKACDQYATGYLKLKGPDSKTRVDYNHDPDVDCVYCGQCTLHCPVGAIREQTHIEAVEKALKNKNKKVIVQTAPSVRVTIGEEFGLEPGHDMTGQMYTAYRKLGFDKIFDVNMGADITTIVEAAELVERIQENGVLPMFTSCCPGWVKFVEFYEPSLMKNLTTARSPQMHSGGAYKTWWAAKEGVDPKDIIVVSVMPCTSKKYEASQDKFKVNGHDPVDFVLTTRELGTLLRRQNIYLPDLEPSEVDREGEYSGAAAIYGASGGVMESALRTAHFFLTGKELDPIDFKPVRGIEGLKEASVTIGKTKLNLCVISTTRNARKIVQEIKEGKRDYHYVEIMACPGGCLGGGGQPLNTSKRIIAQRINGIYDVDRKMHMRRAHENVIVKDFFDYVEKLPKKKQEAILHTHYHKRKKGE